MYMPVSGCFIMTIPRSLLVDVAVTPWYHVISKTVRGAFLLAEGESDRKQWIEDRLQELANLFAIEVAGFAVLDNHLHILLKLEPETASDWSDEDVVRRWGKLYPPRGKNREPQRVTRAWIEQKMADKALVDKWRARLSNLGWFMKCLKEPLARLANKQDGCRGAFWNRPLYYSPLLRWPKLILTATRSCPA